MDMTPSTGNVGWHYHNHNGPGAHPRSYSNRTKDSFCWGYVAGAWNRPLTAF